MREEETERERESESYDQSGRIYASPSNYVRPVTDLAAATAAPAAAPQPPY